MTDCNLQNTSHASSLFSPESNIDIKTHYIYSQLEILSAHYYDLLAKYTQLQVDHRQVQERLDMLETYCMMGQQPEVPSCASMDINMSLSIPTPRKMFPGQVSSTPVKVHFSKPQKLISIAEVIGKYPRLLSKDKASRLAIKMARESVFGEETMRCSTVRGTRDLPALNSDGMDAIRNALYTRLPISCNSQAEFDDVWKCCVAAVGQSCKSLRKKVE
jgi:hypothetical protein